MKKACFKKKLKNAVYINNRIEYTRRKVESKFTLCVSSDLTYTSFDVLSLS